MESKRQLISGQVLSMNVLSMTIIACAESLKLSLHFEHSGQPDLAKEWQQETAKVIQYMFLKFPPNVVQHAFAELELKHKG